MDKTSTVPTEAASLEEQSPEASVQDLSVIANRRKTINPYTSSMASPAESILAHSPDVDSSEASFPTLTLDTSPAPATHHKPVASTIPSTPADTDSSLARPQFALEVSPPEYDPPPSPQRTVFIIGATTRLGVMCTNHFQQKLWNVAAGVSNLEEWRRLEFINGPEAEVRAFELDMLDRDARSYSAQVALSRAVGVFGHLDAIVNCAGTACYGPAEWIKEADLKTQWNENVIGPMNVIAEAIQYLREAGKAGNRGQPVILDIATTTDHAGVPYASTFSATMAAREAFFRGLGQEVHADGIRVLSLYPGIVSNGGQQQQQQHPHPPSGLRKTMVYTVHAAVSAEPWHGLPSAPYKDYTPHVWQSLQVDPRVLERVAACAFRAVSEARHPDKAHVMYAYNVPALAAADARGAGIGQPKAKARDDGVTAAAIAASATAKRVVGVDQYGEFVYGDEDEVLDDYLYQQQQQQQPGNIGLGVFSSTPRPGLSHAASERRRMRPMRSLMALGSEARGVVDAGLGHGRSLARRFSQMSLAARFQRKEGEGKE